MSFSLLNPEVPEFKPSSNDIQDTESTCQSQEATPPPLSCTANLPSSSKSKERKNPIHNRFLDGKNGKETKTAETPKTSPPTNAAVDLSRPHGSHSSSSTHALQENSQVKKEHSLNKTSNDEFSEAYSEV